ncbi:MAG: hypothetical protein RL417_1595 [Pseudomonadota bacterium]|jgi:hypothetical protein
MTVEHAGIYDRNRHLIPAELRRWGRIAYSLFMQRVVGFPVPSTPHFDEVSTPFFVERLRNARTYLEFGSGGSTFLAAELGKNFTTIESDRFFLRSVERKIVSAGYSIKAPSQRLLAVDIGLTEAWGVPVCRKATPARLPLWRRYFTAPWKGDPSFFPDLILVDGRFRVACSLSTALQLADRSDWTLLFDDYAGRPHYQAVEEFLTLSEMVGRMAVFTPKPGVSPDALKCALETFGSDWR